MRTNYIDWDNYFMMVSLVSGLRSKDPSTQVGACIVSPDKKIIGVGYNGLPTGCKDEDYPWDKREGELVDTKYPYICHAELNAILNSTVSVKGATIYVSLFPCNECAKAIIQSGISEIVYLSDKYKDTPTDKISRRMLGDAGVKCRKMKLSHQLILQNIIESDGIDPTDTEYVKISDNSRSKSTIDHEKTPVEKYEEKKNEKVVKSEKSPLKTTIQTPYYNPIYVIDRAIYLNKLEIGDKVYSGNIIRNSIGDLLLVSNNFIYDGVISGSNIKFFPPKTDIYFLSDEEFKYSKNIALELYDCDDTIEEEIKSICKHEIYEHIDNITLFVYSLPLRIIYNIKELISAYDTRHVFHIAYMPAEMNNFKYYYIDGDITKSLLGRVIYRTKTLNTVIRAYTKEITMEDNYGIQK